MAGILREKLESFAMNYPTLDTTRQQELQRCRDELMADKHAEHTH